ncbi:MAG: rhodanese-like domain-containing protein [Erythrobacter sp.]
MKPSLLILASALAFASAACGSDAGKSERKGPGGAPFGFEMAASATAGAAAAPVREMTPDEIASALATGTIRLIDIRTAEEVADGGTIAGAEHIPMEQITADMLDTGDGREVVLYCRSGTRSLATATRLAQEAGKPVTHMPGGILAWRERIRLAEACQEDRAQGC